MTHVDEDVEFLVVFKSGSRVELPAVQDLVDGHRQAVHGKVQAVCSQSSISIQFPQTRLPITGRGNILFCDPRWIVVPIGKLSFLMNVLQNWLV